MKLVRVAVASVAVVAVATQAASAAPPEPTLEGRAVLPVATYAPGPQSGAFFAGQTINGISFPTPSQPVQGFSAVVSGRRPGEYLAMADNGFGNKANSFDFLLRAYYVTPDFKTAKGGTGAVDVDLDDFVQFRDPNSVIGFPIQRPADRLLTGADLDPESLQRGKDGDLWMGDEFGPWILHFDETGVLLEPPFRVPAALVGSTSVTGFLESPEQPVHLVGEPRRPWPAAAASNRWRRRPTASTCTGCSKARRCRTRTRTADTCWSSASPTGPSPAGSGSTARSRPSPARSSAASWPTCGPSTSTGWS